VTTATGGGAQNELLNDLSLASQVGAFANRAGPGLRENAIGGRVASAA
jgi:hypothetical protein